MTVAVNELFVNSPNMGFKAWFLAFLCSGVFLYQQECFCTNPSCVAVDLVIFVTVFRCHN